MKPSPQMPATASPSGIVNRSAFSIAEYCNAPPARAPRSASIGWVSRNSVRARPASAGDTVVDSAVTIAESESRGGEVTRASSWCCAAATVRGMASIGTMHRRVDLTHGRYSLHRSGAKRTNTSDGHRVMAVA